MKDDGTQSVLAHEKGYSTYTRVPDEDCKAAVEWWEKNSNKWKIVRDKWNTIYGLNQDLALKPAVDDKKLYSYLFSPTVVDREEIESTIDMFLMD